MFFSSILLISVLNAMAHHIFSGINFNSSNHSQVDYGRILDFKTKRSEFQEKPTFSH